jgi:hypothetical protein
LDTIAVAASVTVVWIGGHRWAWEKGSRNGSFFIGVAMIDTEGSRIVIDTTNILVSAVIVVIIIIVVVIIVLCIKRLNGD